MSKVKSENGQPQDDGQSTADPLLTEESASLPADAEENGVPPPVAPSLSLPPSNVSPVRPDTAAEETGSVGPVGPEEGLEPVAAVGQGIWESATDEIKSAQTRHSELLEAIAGSVGQTVDRLAALENGQVLVSRDLKGIQGQLQDLTAEGPVGSPRSLIDDVFRLYDLAVAMGTNLDERPMIPVEEFKQRISLMAAQIAQVLQLNGLELIEPKAGEVFNGRLHMARGKVPCDDPTKHRTIAAVHEPGFCSESFVFRPAGVDVWVCEEATREEGSAAGTGPAPAASDAAAATRPRDGLSTQQGKAVEPPPDLAKRPAEERPGGPCETAGQAPVQGSDPEE